MTIPDRRAAIEAVLRAIKPELDDASLKGIMARIDPDWHRTFFERTEPLHESRQQIAKLYAALAAALPVLRDVNPQAWIWLRMDAYNRSGVLLPYSPGQLHWFAPPGLIEQLEALLVASAELGAPRRGVRPKLMVERAVAGACASVYFDLCRRCPPTTHPDHRTRTPEPYHALVEAVFEGWHLTGWENRAVAAAKELRAAVGESKSRPKRPDLALCPATSRGVSTSAALSKGVQQPCTAKHLPTCSTVWPPP